MWDSFGCSKWVYTLRIEILAIKISKLFYYFFVLLTKSIDPLFLLDTDRLLDTWILTLYFAVFFNIYLFISHRLLHIRNKVHIPSVYLTRKRRPVLNIINEMNVPFAASHTGEKGGGFLCVRTYVQAYFDLVQKISIHQRLEQNIKQRF